MDYDDEGTLYYAYEGSERLSGPVTYAQGMKILARAKKAAGAMGKHRQYVLKIANGRSSNPLPVGRFVKVNAIRRKNGLIDIYGIR